MRNEKRYVIVDQNVGEIFINNYDGYLPPMTEQQIADYFDTPYDVSKAVEKYNLKLYAVDENHLCPHCQNPLAKSDNKEYVWQCWYCDEDFYDIEVIKEV